MLVRLFGENFRSLKKPFELSLVAADLTHEDDRERGYVEVSLAGAEEPLRILRVAAIFGANASGKSTVLTAGRALNWIITSSSLFGKPGGSLDPYEPFALDNVTRSSPVRIGCDVVHKTDNGAELLRYEVVYGSRVIHRESLTLITEGSEQVLIQRVGGAPVSGGLIESSDANKLYVKGMQPNVSVLAKLAQHGPDKGPESAQPYHASLRRALSYEDYGHAATGRAINPPADDRFHSDKDYRQWVMDHLIRAADVGIRDARTAKEKMELPEGMREAIEKQLPTIPGIRLPDQVVEVEFVHAGVHDHSIDFANESGGTQKLFNLSNDWWTLAHEPITLLADELGAGLHPRLVDKLVRAVNQPTSAGTRSQLVFVTHETGLLESMDGLPPALRRDQVYFTRKDTQGATELYSLAEFKDDARPVHNLRKRYLSGLYGAIPSLEKLSL